jgi:hypothetical protein
VASARNAKAVSSGNISHTANAILNGPIAASGFEMQLRRGPKVFEAWKRALAAKIATVLRSR